MIYRLRPFKQDLNAISRDSISSQRMGPSSCKCYACQL